MAKCGESQMAIDSHTLEEMTQIKYVVMKRIL